MYITCSFNSYIDFVLAICTTKEFLFALNSDLGGISYFLSLLDVRFDSRKVNIQFTLIDLEHH